MCIRVLILEPDDDVLAAFLTYLKRATDFEYLGVKSVKECVEQIEMFKPHVVMMESSLPGECVSDVFQGIDELRCDYLPVLVLSRRGEDPDRPLHENVVEHMVKPQSMGKIAQTITRLGLPVGLPANKSNQFPTKDNFNVKKNEPVTKIMASELVTIDHTEPVSKARKLLEPGEHHHLPVVHGRELVGILSSKDLLRVTFGEFGDQDGRSLDAMLDHTFQLSDVMNSSPVTLSKDSTIRDAAQLLAKHSFHSIPIVDGAELVGLVTSTDLIRYLLEQY